MKKYVLACLSSLLSLAHAADVWTVTNADTAITLRRMGDRIVLASLRGPSDGAEWVGGNPADIPLPRSIFIGDALRPVQWRFQEATAGQGGDSVVLKFICTNPPLKAESIWQSKPGGGPIEHHVEISNAGRDQIQLRYFPFLNLNLTAENGHVLENLWVEKGAGRPTDFGTHREPIRSGYRFAGRSTPYAEAPEMIPWLSIQDVSGLSGVYVGLEFSGRVSFGLQAAGEPLELSLGIDSAESEQNVRTDLAQGGRFISPTAFVGCYRGNVDAGANRLHRYIEAHLRPPTSDERFPLVVNNSWGSGMAVDEKLARKMIDDSAALGVELFHMDAGWFRSVGDWYPDNKKFPRGLASLSDYARSKGLLFGLWVGWTQGGIELRDEQTLAVTNPKQRDWFTRDYPANWKPAEFTGATVCLAAEPARRWCLEELRRVVRDYRLDLLEHDQMMVVDQCARTNHGHTRSPVDISYHAARGYYAVYDQLRRENPRLLFENCVNGGRMVDFGVAQRTHYVSITDTYDPLSNRRAFYDSSYPLPPSMCECYIENKPGPSVATFKSMVRSGMMGWCTLMCDTGAWTAEQHEAARRQIEIYKSWIRPLINHGDLYHISERPDDVRWDGMEYFDAQTGKGVVFAFRGAKAEELNHVFIPMGLDPNASYSVWSEDGAFASTELKGARLLKEGIRLELSAPGTSDLLYLQRR